MKLGQPTQQYHTDFNIVLLEEEWIHPESDLDTLNSAHLTEQITDWVFNR